MKGSAIKQSARHQAGTYRPGSATVERSAPSNPNTVEPIPERALPAALAELGSVIHAIEINQTGLYERLDRVLEPTGPADHCAEEKAMSSLEPPLVEVVYSHIRRLRAIFGQQDDILSRLQV